MGVRTQKAWDTYSGGVSMAYSSLWSLGITFTEFRDFFVRLDDDDSTLMGSGLGMLTAP